MNPDSLMVWPKNLTSWTENWHFFEFNVTFSFWSLISTSRMRSSYCVAPNMSMSSIWHNTPSIPSRMADILLWKCSGANEMPKGNRLKQNLPKGVMKVVSKADSSANGTFQKPEFASSFKNIPASDNCPRVYATEGISCHSWRTLSFNFVDINPDVIFLWDDDHACTQIGRFFDSHDSSSSSFGFFPIRGRHSGFSFSSYFYQLHLTPSLQPQPCPLSPNP